MICLDTCGTAGDGVCQDGGWGARGDWCAYGTDCSDCGSRLVLDPRLRFNPTPPLNDDGNGGTPDIDEGPATAISAGGGGGNDASRPLVMYILTGVLGLFGLTLIVLLVVSCFTEKAKPQPNRNGTPSADGPVG